MPTLFRQLQPHGENNDSEHPPERPWSGSSRTAAAAAAAPQENRINGNSCSRSKMRGASKYKSSSQVRTEVRREFLKSTTRGQEEVFTNPESLPSMEMAYNTFRSIYPKIAETSAVDDLREREFFHLEESNHVCMDYCGFGLFSYHQQVVNKASASFGLAYISANLPTHALYGAADEGTVEFYIRKRVMDYLNVKDTEYSMVFTASRGSAFRLLGETYPFLLNPRLLTVYDFESEAVTWMAECAKQKGAKIMSASFKWPSLRIGTSHLKKLLQEKKKKSEPAKGLFVFPVQSRMTGAKYSYQWMSEAQQNKWHVLLDVSSLGPKDMDSLGLSLFRPDFIVSSFYKVFGTDPTGFGCLFIKNTVIDSLHNSSRARAIGMVRLVSLSNFASEGPPELVPLESEEINELKLSKRSWWKLGCSNGNSERSFSGPYFAAEEVYEISDHIGKESHLRTRNSQKRICNKMTRQNSELFLERTGSNDLMETVSGTGGKFSAQAAKARYKFSERMLSEIEEKEQPNAGSTGIGHSSQRYGRSESETKEMIDEKVYEFGTIQTQSRSQRRVTERFSEELAPEIEFRSFGGIVVSPIPEEGIEDIEDEEAGEQLECERLGKAGVVAHESGGTQTIWDGGVNETEEEGFYLGVMSLNASIDLGWEALKDGGRMQSDSSDVDDSPLGSGSDLKETASEEIVDSNNRASEVEEVIAQINTRTSKVGKEIPETNNRASEVEDAGESSDPLRSREVTEDVVEQNLDHPTKSEAGRQSSVMARLRSFDGRASFKRLTGKVLSDFQEMGVQGLVQKFKKLQIGNAIDYEVASNNFPVFHGVTMKNEEWQSSEHAVTETASGRPLAGEDFKQDADIKGGGTDCVPNCPEMDPSFMKTKVETATKDARPAPLVQGLVQKSKNLQRGMSTGFGFAGKNFSVVDKLVGNTEDGRYHVAEGSSEHFAPETLSGTLTAGVDLKQTDLKAGTAERGSSSWEIAMSFQETKVEAMLASARPEPSVQGLVEKFQNLQSGNSVGVEASSSNFSAIYKSTGNIEEESHATTNGNPGNAASETANVSATAGGDAREDVDISADSTESYFNCQEIDLSSMKMNVKPIESVGSKSLVQGLVQKFQKLESWNSVRFEPGSSNFSAVEKSFKSIEEVKGAVAESSPGHAVSATASVCPAGAGDLNQGVGFFSSGELELYFTDINVGAMIKSASPETMLSASDSHLSGKSAGTAFVGELEDFADMDHLPTRGNIGQSLQQSSSSQSHNESGEDNYITILPSRSMTSSSRNISETLMKAQAENETNSANTGQNARVPSKTDSSSSENRFGDKYAGEKVFKPSDRSPNSILDRNLSPRDTKLYHVARPNHVGIEGTSTIGPSSKIADIQDTEIQGVESSCSDLRCNKILSRDIDFEDELYLERSSCGSDMLGSRTQSMTLAEDSARIDLEENDEESFFQSPDYSGSLHRSNLSMDMVDEGGDMEYDYEDIPEAALQEGHVNPEIICKGLDFADSLGLTKLNYRLRYLINWLVNSLLNLRHPGPNQGLPLVRIYGPKVKYDRGAAIAFNLFDWKGLLIPPGLVQRLADRSNISLGVGRLCNIVDPEMSSDFMAEKERLLGMDKTDQGRAGHAPHSGGAGPIVTIPVVTAATGFLTNFEDIYKLWCYVAKFLDADYVVKENWRYHALNQQVFVL